MSRSAAALFNLQELPLPAQFLNAYEITNVGSLSWPVAIYKVDRIDGRPQSHEDRGQIKTVIWNLFRKHKSRCSGFRFVIDIGKQLVAVPETWQLPSGATDGDYKIERLRAFEAEATNEKDQSIVAGIIREALLRDILRTIGLTISESYGKTWISFASCQDPTTVRITACAVGLARWLGRSGETFGS